MEGSHFYMKAKGRRYGFINYHRLDGPAIEYTANGLKMYYVNGVQFLEEKFWNHPEVIKNKLENILRI